MSKDALPIKAFLNQVEKRLSKCSADELQSILRQMAVNLSPSERRDFLEELKPADTEDVLEQTLQTDDLLVDIDDLIADVEEVAATADDYESSFHDYGH